METPPLGDQELEVLNFISEHAPITARDVAERFGEERGLARTTILTVMERLRKKGYVVRKRRDGVFQYSPRVPQSEVIQGVVGQFIERTLGGSVSPLLAYLSKTRQVSREELAELESLVDELRSERSEGDR
jgi:predicted transcriptional regulator